MTYKTYEELLATSDLGVSDGAPINGILSSFMAGAQQAIWNIVNDEKAVEHGIAHLDDADPDYWEEGHNAVLRHYKKLKGL